VIQKIYSLLFLLTLLTDCTQKSNYIFKDRLELNTYHAADVMTQDEISVTLKKEGRRLKIKWIQPHDIDAVTHLMKLNIESLFQDYVAPYPGVVSKKITCPDEFKPTKISLNNKQGTFNGYLFYANSRYTPGECVKNNISYFYYRGLFKCHEKSTVVDLVLFSPYKPLLKDKSIENTLGNLSCL
jgi:hypothetical protein